MGNYDGIILFTHKKGRNRILFISTFFFFAITVLCSCHHPTEAILFQLPDGQILQSGDLVFREGRSLESHTVIFADSGSVYSHVGLVLWTTDGWQVLHAVPNERNSENEKDSVKLEPIGVFFRSDRAIHGAIYRLPIETEDSMKLLRKGLMLYQRHPLFDGNFDDCDSNAFYCTELVWFIYLSETGIDLSQGRRHKVPLFPPLIFCSDLLTYPELEKIYEF